MENILQENAMLITLQINCAGFTRKDRDVTDKVNAEHAASPTLASMISICLIRAWWTGRSVRHVRHVVTTSG